ncbi:MAG TPA: deaminase, partial [Bacillota bacterium]|nr:deaminase [Bacillota bacterium]
LCRGLHAEQNCIIQAAVHGVQLEGSTIYCTFQPCVVCAKMLINAGITEIVYEGGYPDEMSVDMLDEAGIKLRRLGPEEEDGR